MVRALVALAALLVGCTPAKPPRASVVMREGTTVRTSCPDAPPQLEDPGFDGAPFEDVTIDRICVYGGSADGLLTFAVGERINAGAVREGVDKLVKSKRFDDVEIGAELRGGGAIVYVNLHELPLIESSGKRLDPYEASKEKRTCVTDLVARGYGAAKCEMAITPTDPGKVRVDYKVTKGPQWKVDSLVFQNSSKLTTRELEAATSLSTGEIYDFDRVAVAGMHVLDAYYNHGMVTAKVDDPRIDVTDAGAVTGTWNVSEGDVFFVHAITLGKSKPWMAKELLPLLRLRRGMVFDRAAMAADLQKLRDYAEAKKKKRIEITPAVQLDITKKTVDLELDVEEKD